MIKKGRISAIASWFLLVAILTGLLAIPAWGQQPERVKVLIAFGRQPARAEEALVRGMGGSVKYTYHLVPAIAATLPEPAISALVANPHVTRVEPDRQMRALDIELDNAWGVTRIGAGTVHDGDVGDDGGNRGDGVRLAIIDSGINYNHPDLDDNYAGGADFVELDGDPMDVYGHGTHVAGTACAEDNGNGIDDETDKFGVVGVAPLCDLYALKVLDDAGYGYASDLIAALDWAVAHDIQVANLSLGWDLNPGDTVRDAFDAAWTEGGLVIVAAACNNGNRPGRGDNVCYPALYDSVIAVAATDGNDQRASFSSTGEQVELAAPGVSVFSTWNDDTGYYAPDPVCHLEETEEGLQRACYKYGSGTSMASPHVAGVAALILSANDGWSNDQVRDQLRVTADDLGTTGWDPLYGYGLVDAAEAAAGPANEPPVVEITSPGDGATFDQGDEIQFAGTAGDVEDGDLTAGLAWTSSIDGPIGTGGSVSYVLSAGNHTVTASVTDSGGRTGSASIAVVVNPPAGQTVTVESLEGSSYWMNKNFWKATIVATIDPVLEGATVSGTWTGGTTASCTTGADGQCQVTLNLRKQTSSTAFTVSDVALEGYTYVPGVATKTVNSP